MELKTNNMGYTPYKMKGHSLPGINQSPAKKSSPTKWVQFIPMAISAVSALSKAKKQKEEE
tara:strand:+ start:647 stop:829 length:183 start_codon:yes stop_codon:yes gene_type:complete